MTQLKKQYRIPPSTQEIVSKHSAAQMNTWIPLHGSQEILHKGDKKEIEDIKWLSAIYRRIWRLKSLESSVPRRFPRRSLEKLRGKLQNCISTNGINEATWPELSRMMGRVPVINEKTSQKASGPFHIPSAVMTLPPAACASQS